MSLEDQLVGWTGPSSATEQDKQDRTERMIREAVASHRAFEECSLRVFAKGSYANNTNVRTDSDVDVAVECTDVIYWQEEAPGSHPGGDPYEGVWTPEKLRSELEAALRSKFPGQIDTSGSTAIQVNSNTARVDADVVPCFTYRYYFKSGEYAQGTRIFKRSGTFLDNYPAQQLENGRSKNRRTGTRFKKAVRVLKRVENAMVLSGEHREVPSYFIECLTYNCADQLFGASTWIDTIRNLLVSMWEQLEGEEPEDPNQRWVEVNERFFLFHGGQAWNRADGRDFVLASWNYLGFNS